jgi:uncharacterized membrane protein
MERSADRMTALQSITQPIQPSAPSLRPVDPSERIVPVDILRGVALLAQLSQLPTFFGFFALIFIVKPCVFIGAF